LALIFVALLQLARFQSERRIVHAAALALHARPGSAE